MLFRYYRPIVLGSNIIKYVFWIVYMYVYS